jgi:hypothetical protein
MIASGQTIQTFVAKVKSLTILATGNCLAGQPQRVAKRLEHSPAVVRAENAIPIKECASLHGHAPVPSPNSLF